MVDDCDGGARLTGGRGRCLAVLRFGLVPLFLFVVFGRFLLAGGPLGDDTRAAGPGGQLGQLALAEQRGRAEALALLRQLADDLEAERLAQALELLQRRPLFRVADAGSCTLTSIVLGRGASVRADMVVLRGFQVRNGVTGLAPISRSGALRRRSVSPILSRPPALPRGTSCHNRVFGFRSGTRDGLADNSRPAGFPAEDSDPSLDEATAHAAGTAPVSDRATASRPT